MKIEPMQVSDWPAVLCIYLEGVDTGIATFETEAPAWECWNTSHLAGARLVVRIDGQLAGWAALSPVSSRRCYAGVAEVSIYIGSAFRGQGVGRVLLAALIAESERSGIWTLQATIFAINEASLGLHQQAGFRMVGRRERIAQRDGQWYDTIVLERRSRVVGV